MYFDTSHNLGEFIKLRRLYHTQCLRFYPLKRVRNAALNFQPQSSIDHHIGVLHSHTYVPHPSNHNQLLDNSSSLSLRKPIDTVKIITLCLFTKDTQKNQYRSVQHTFAQINYRHLVRQIKGKILVY